MSIELFVKGHYQCPADVLFERATHFSDIIDANTKAASFKGLASDPMVENQAYSTDIRVLGFIKLDQYKIKVDKLCPVTRVLKTTEFNKNIRIWRHRIQIKPTATGAVWIDRIIMDACKMTPFLARFAQYAHKQRHQYRNASNIETSIVKSSRMTSPLMPIFVPND